MKKILLISQEYYPLNSPPSHRIHSFAKHLPESGFRPTILCLNWDRDPCDKTWDGGHYYDPEFEVVKVCRTERVRFSWPERTRLSIFRNRLLPLSWPPGLANCLLARAEELLDEEKYDVILATCPPPVALSVASRLGQTRRLPWVADLRDVAGEHGLQCKWSRPWQLRYWFWTAWAAHQEARVCRTAAAATTVSAPLAQALLARRVPNVAVIANGFDPDDYAQIVRGKTNAFRIVYAGRLVGDANPSPLFDAIDLLLNEGTIRGNDFEVCFFGTSGEALESHLRDHRCKAVVNLEGIKTRGEIQRITRNASLLLQLAYPKQRGIITSKFFEYLGAGRPILSIPKDSGVIDALLTETGAGWSATTPREIAEIVDRLYREWRENGDVAYGGNPVSVSQYTRQAQSEKLARILDGVLQQGRLAES